MVHIDYSDFESDKEEQRKLYQLLLKPRLVEEKMQVLLRQGRISKWFSGWGQEAISVGTSMAMNDDEYILTMHRNLGVFTSRNVPLAKLFSQFQGKMNGFTKGRDRSFHFGTHQHKIVGMISHLGSQLGVANGMALAHKIRRDNKCILVFSGDGGASEGDFHEALNVASVWQLPVLFIIENNQWGLSTPSNQQFNFDSFIVKGPAYGMEAHSVDGNNILEVYEKSKALTESIRKNPRPILLECKSFRIRGHEEASGTKYYPEGQVEEWQLKDPLNNYEEFLLAQGIIHSSEVDVWKKKFRKEINKALQETGNESPAEFNVAQEISDVFAPYEQEIITTDADLKEIRLVDAIANGLDEAMNKFQNLVIMGQDIAQYGGVFKVTEGLLEKYGEDRVRNTPLCESGIVGAALGLSINKYKAIVEMQFADFVTEGFTQIVNNLAKTHWRWGQNADVVIRMPTGAGVKAGPFHSQSNEAWFTHTPGLKVVYPAFPADAKGLLLASIEDPNPVMFFEHKKLYRSIKEEVPEGYFTQEIGKANVIRQGEDITIITYGMGVHWALELLDQEPAIKADLIDLRSLVPLDTATFITSVNKTGRAIVLQEDCLFGGIASDIASIIQELCFKALDAPVKRVGSLDTPVPFAETLEKGFLPVERFKESVRELLDY